MHKLCDVLMQKEHDGGFVWGYTCWVRRHKPPVAAAAIAVAAVAAVAVVAVVAAVVAAAVAVAVAAAAVHKSNM